MILRLVLLWCACSVPFGLLIGAAIGHGSDDSE